MAPACTHTLDAPQIIGPTAHTTCAVGLAVQYFFSLCFIFPFLFLFPFSGKHVPSSITDSMTDEPVLLSRSIDNFFLRSGLTLQDQIDCISFVEKLFPGKPIAPSSCQGYCSMTLFVGGDTVIQFRPATYKLDLKVTTATREVYGSFAPVTRYISTIPTSGLLVYSMQRVNGVSFGDFREGLGKDASHFREALCRDFATFLSKGFNCNKVADIPLGIVGSSITLRLESLSKDLPVRFQSTALGILGQLPRIKALPWVLTHGDITPSNIIVNPATGRLAGFVDWAEAEHLPFGVCLYGLEELLGEMTPTGFRYHRDASDLRDVFWAELCKQISDLRNKHTLEAVRLARDLGVLLWHGIAFDNGAIDRVVQEGRDFEEIYRLDAFLGLEKPQSVNRASRI